MKIRTLVAGLAGLTILSACAPVASAAVNSKQYGTTIQVAGQKVMTVNHVVANDPNSGKTTSWISAWDIQTLMSKLGIQAHWVGPAKQLVLSMPMGYTVPQSLSVPYHSPKSGQFVVMVDSKSIAYLPSLGNTNNSYLPVYYLMKVLDSIGVTSHWTGANWGFENKAHVQPQSAMAGDVSRTFPLKLSNEPNGSAKGLPTPPVPPSPDVTVKLPMNSQLTPTNQSLGDGSEALPAEDYVQTGRATYVVNQPIAAVESWFKAAYTAQGFSQTGSGSSGDFKTGSYVESQTFTPTKQASGQEEHVTMSYSAQGQSQTKVEYWVYDTVVPARPSSSEIANDATSMQVQVTQTGSGQSPKTSSYDVTNAQTIQQVIDAVNGLTVIDPPGITSGPMYTNSSQVTLTFHFADGNTTTVKATKNGSNYGDVTVGDVPLKDSNGTVWQAVMQAIQA